MRLASQKLTSAMRVMSVVLAAALTACGGDGKSNGGSSGLPFPASSVAIPANSTGSFRTLVATSNGAGAITAGGQAYNVATATITDGSQTSSVAAIRSGSLVTLTLNNGVVSTVDIAPVFSGPVSSVNAGAFSFSGLGQTINVDANTTYIGTSLATLTLGNVVTVRGFIQSPGIMLATRVDLVSATLAPNARIYAAGIAQATNSTTKTFDLGNLSLGTVLNVNYASATNLGATSVGESTPVIASSTMVPFGGSTQFTAQEVLLFNGTAATASVTFPGTGNVGGIPGATQVRGIVANSSGSGQITIGTQSYSIGSATITERGQVRTATAIRTGSLVTVNLSNGAVSAVEIHPLFVGPLESVNAAGGTLTGYGQTIRVDGSTVYNGRPLNFLSVGNAVAVSGYLQAGALYATSVDLLGDALTFGTKVSVAGTTQFVNTNARTFSLGALSVNYTAATNAPTALVDNTPVVVSTTTAPIGNQFAAQEVLAFTGIQTAPGNPVTPTNGISASGHIDGIALSNGVFSLLGIPFTVNTSTVFVNQPQPSQPLSLATLPPRAKVQVTATVGLTPGTYLAQQVTLTSVTDDGDSDTVTLSGPLTALADPSMGLATLRITTSFGTQFVITGATRDAPSFFSTARIGTVVTVNGTYTAFPVPVINANRVAM